LEKNNDIPIHWHWNYIRAVYCWGIYTYVNYARILEVYSLEDILELNDKTSEDCLGFLVEEGYIDLPSIKPLDFND
jgi:hypothetical protein